MLPLRNTRASNTMKNNEVPALKGLIISIDNDKTLKDNINKDKNKYSYFHEARHFRNSIIFLLFT